MVANKSLSNKLQASLGDVVSGLSVVPDLRIPNNLCSQHSLDPQQLGHKFEAFDRYIFPQASEVEVVKTSLLFLEEFGTYVTGMNLAWIAVVGPCLSTGVRSTFVPTS